MDVDTTRWSGEGAFTQLLIDALRELRHVALLRVENAPASRADSGYNFIANDIFVSPRHETRHEPARVLGVIPWRRATRVPLLGLHEIATHLRQIRAIGEPDYADEGMIQYLRTERVVAPYQTRGAKVVELVRIYRTDAPQR